MTDTSALRAFIEVRLAEDEQAANKAARFRYDHPLDAPWERARIAVERRAAASSDPHIARQNPARSLREVAAKRAILAAAVDVTEMSHDTAKGLLLQLASVWSDHSEYQRSWAVDLSEREDDY